jgi:sugar phosphate isomerase/epimerase
VVVTHFAHKNGKIRRNNDEEHFDTIMRHTKECYGKIITTENLPRAEPKTKHQNPHELYSFLCESGCFLTYDTSHAATHKQDILDDVERFIHHLRNIHLSDFENGNEHKALGTGDLPIEQFLKKLIEQKYSFPITLEFDFENERRNSIKNNSDAISKIEESIRFVNDVVCSSEELQSIASNRMT